jgi:hypothetical protein
MNQVANAKKGSTPEGRFEMKKYLMLTGLLGMFLFLSSSIAHAAIVTTTSPVVQIAPPPSVVAGQLQSDIQIPAFDEQQNVVLATNLLIDIALPGTYDGTNPLTPGVIQSGTTVSSHYVHFDAATDTFSSGLGISGGSIKFDHQIIGVIIQDTNLDASDSVVGVSTTTYPSGLNTFRGLEMVGFEGDSITVGCDTITVNSLFVQGLTDQFRVLTGTQSCTPTGGLEGCAPKTWRKPDMAQFWTGYQYSDKFNEVFGIKSATKALTLRQALGTKKGAERAFQRQAVAALLNSTNSVVNYAYTPAQVKSIVQSAYQTKSFKAARVDFASQNNLGCIFETLP